MEIQTIRGSRSKAAGYLVVSLGFSAVGVWMATSPSKPEDIWKGWTCAGFFGLCALVFGVRFLFPNELSLDERGFSLRMGFPARSRKTLWRDVDRFFVHRGLHGETLIAFNYKPDRAPPSTLRRLVRAVGADGALPKSWPMSPQALVDLLNEQRARYGGR